MYLLLLVVVLFQLATNIEDLKRRASVMSLWTVSGLADSEYTSMSYTWLIIINQLIGPLTFCLSFK